MSASITKSVIVCSGNQKTAGFESTCLQLTVSETPPYNGPRPILGPLIRQTCAQSVFYHTVSDVGLITLMINFFSKDDLIL